MPQRFGQQVDPSQTFAYLADRNTDLLQSRAAAFDRRREEEQAAQDSLMFERYNQGQISGGEILAYIRSRIAATSYDKAQQRKWREALAQYESAVADELAEGAYAESGNIHALIGHYARRLRTTKRGTPEYTDIAQRLRTLQTERDNQDYRKALTRINNQIIRGDASTKDLIKFYKDQLAGLPPGSPLRDEIRQRLVEAQEQRRNELFETGMKKIDLLLQQGQITPRQAGEQKQQILRRFDVEQRDPVAFWDWMLQINTLKATPSPTELLELQAQLSAGDISVDEYQERLFNMADRLAPYSAEAAWQLRNEAVKGIESATPLPNAQALGRNLTSSALQHISQLDGSKYSQLNCTMAAAAMLASAMGFEGLSGGDLRYLSGDTAGGTTILQAQIALNEAGVEGTRARYHDRIEFEAFKNRMMNGAPAVLSGWNGDIDQRFNSSGIIAGHAIFVAGYDPKKRAFLVYDPAKSKDNGTWWPENQMEAFGWHGMRHGQALFAPGGTLNPQTLRRAGNKAVRHISVNDPPRRPQTPRNYVGQFNQGRDASTTASQAEAKRQQRDQRRKARRAQAADIDSDIDTTQEAQADLALRDKFLIESQQILQEFQAQYDGTSDTVSVTIGATTQDLSLDDIRQIQRDLLFSLDGQELIYEALDDGKNSGEIAAKIADIRGAKRDILTQAAELDTQDEEFLINRVSVNLLRDILDANNTSDPKDVLTALEQGIDTLSKISPEAPVEATDRRGAGAQNQRETAEADANADRTQVEQDVESLDELGQAVQALTGIQDVLAAFADPDMMPEERTQAVLDWAAMTGVTLPTGWPDDPKDDGKADPLGEVLARYASVSNAHYAVENGEAMYIVYKGELTTVPVAADPGFTAGGQRAEGEPIGAQGTLESGEDVTVPIGTGARPVPDLSGLVDLPPGYANPNSLPEIFIRQYGNLERVPVVPQEVEYGKNPDGSGNAAPFLRIVDAAGLKELGVESETGYLSANDLSLLRSRLGPSGLSEMVRSGALEEVPFRVMIMETPPTRHNPVGAIWFQDPGTGQWHKDGFPFAEQAGDPSTLGAERGVAYLGAAFATLANGQKVLMPDAEWDVDLQQNASTAVPMAMADEADVVAAAKVYEEGVAMGEIVPPEYARDSYGNIVSAQSMESLGSGGNPYGGFKRLGDAMQQSRSFIEDFTRQAAERAQGIHIDAEVARRTDPMAGVPSVDEMLANSPWGVEAMAEQMRQFGITDSQQQQERQDVAVPPPNNAAVQQRVEERQARLARQREATASRLPEPVRQSLKRGPFDATPPVSLPKITPPVSRPTLDPRARDAMRQRQAEKERATPAPTTTYRPPPTINIGGGPRGL